MEITVFLLILITALLLGNALLSMLKPRAEPDKRQSVKSEMRARIAASASKHFPAQGRAKQENVDELNKRIERVENLLLKVNGSQFLGKKLNGTVLGRKLNDFVQFKNNTKIEIEALKEDLANTKKDLGVKEKEPKENYKISDEALHNLVFRGSSREN